MYTYVYKCVFKCTYILAGIEVLFGRESNQTIDPICRAHHKSKFPDKR